MTVHPSPSVLIRSVTWAICLTFLLILSPVSADDYLGPVFPENTLSEDALFTPELAEPLPLPKRNPLLQRPQSKQVVFDDLDPIGSIVSPTLRYEEEINFTPPVVRQRRAIATDDVIFTDNGEYVHGQILGEYPSEVDSFVSGPFPVAFGMGLFDNLTLFGESTTFKSGLNSDGGIMGLGEGLNWSAAVTPQGTVTAQYGVRAVQGDLYSGAARSQVFQTAGLFKRFDFWPVQGGVAIDWLHDHSGHYGSVDLRQMRCELSYRTFSDLECGFLGGFNVFQDRPKSPRRDVIVDIHDYYLLFVRKHLARGGQIELRCGSTAQGDFIMSAVSEAAMSDRLAVNGGIMMLAPACGRGSMGSQQESWAMSLGIVIYFRGGAMCRQMNSYRPMFDVAGNNSFFTRIVR
jgi:hypothetical protein